MAPACRRSTGDSLAESLLPHMMARTLAQGPPTAAIYCCDTFDDIIYGT